MIVSLLCFCAAVIMSKGDSPFVYKSHTICGDWTPYGDEKCLKIAERAEHQTQEDGEATCRDYTDEVKVEPPPKLLTVKSKEEQKFVQQFLFRSNEVADNVWLGLVKNKDSSIFEWNDGSQLSYNNWANYTIYDERHRCVEMGSGEGILATGLWSRTSCRRKNVVVCEKMPNWTVETLQTKFLQFKLEQEAKEKELEEKQKEWAMKQKQWEQLHKDLWRKVEELGLKLTKSLEDTSRVEQKVSSMDNNPVPIGFIYVQLPGQDPPAILWSEAKWIEVSSNYTGLFFRVVGGKAAEFGKIQDGASPRLHEIQTAASSNHVHQPITVPPNGLWSEYIYTGMYVASSRAYLRFRLSSEEVRPRNQAVKIWQRVK